MYSSYGLISLKRAIHENNIIITTAVLVIKDYESAFDSITFIQIP